MSKSNSGHTPGPWSVNYSRFNEVRTDDGAVIATCNKLNGLVNLQANARLIAAAPDLLEALKSALQTAKFEKHPFRAWHEEARAAISRVEGKS